MIRIVESIFDFYEQDIQQKVKLLYEHGAFVVSIRYYEYKINLYLINNHYVEVFYHHKKGMIEKIEPMDWNSTRMKFYLDQVKLSPCLR